jgi:hypothetical protein
MDEDKPRERDTQSPALASAKRILAHGDPSPRRRAAHVRPHGAVGVFLRPFVRKPLIILDSGKRNEIL